MRHMEVSTRPFERQRVVSVVCASVSARLSANDGAMVAPHEGPGIAPERSLREAAGGPCSEDLSWAVMGAREYRYRR